MAEWETVTRCNECGKIYEYGVPEVCRRCGTVIATINMFSKLMGLPCMEITNNASKVIARKRIFRKWEVKEENL